MLTQPQLIELVMNSFMAEKENDPDRNSKLIDDNFAFTDMVYAQTGQHLPRLDGEPLANLIKEAFQIKGREFIFKTIMADVEQQKVVIEFIESYPDTETGKTYRTPQVGIYEIKSGKIYRTRHYFDPRLSYEYLSPETIEKAFE